MTEMKKYFKRIYIRPAFRHTASVFTRTGLMAVLAGAGIFLESCTKDPEMPETGRTEIGLEQDGWGTGGATGIFPDRGDRIRVNPEQSSLPEGAELSEDGSTLRLSHLAADFVLAIESDDELEIVSPEGVYLFDAVPAGRTPEGDGYDGVNYFRITKGLYAPGVEAAEISLDFRRKNLSNAYPEDNIKVKLSANPVTVEGVMDFDNPSYSYDFAMYVDNELGVFSIPPGRTLSVEYAPEEDSWVKVEQISGTDRWRVLGGWRPNDPTADGREQKAVLVISDGYNREEYTVSRRNYGLPVTLLHGVWWCKYNSMGDSRNFDDQILSSEDPAAMAGKTAFAYLSEAAPEKFRELWQWAYIGDSGRGMKVTEKDGIAVMDGYSPAHVNINRLPADALSPDGYELPSMEDFNRLFDASGTVWMAWSGSYQLKEPWNGHSIINRQHARQNGVQVGALTLSDLIVTGLSSPDYPEHEPLVWYGPGAQWNDSGIEHSGHYNNILFSVHSPSGEGWYIGGNMGNLFVYKNGAGTSDTRILRFRKSDVEYIY